MEKELLIQKITGKTAARPYHLPASFELVGHTFCLDLPEMGDLTLNFEKDRLLYNGKEAAYRAVKCEEDLFLIGFGRFLLLLDTKNTCAVFTNGRNCWSNFPEKENPLPGFETVLRFGAEMRYPCIFEKDAITLDKNRFPARYLPYSDHQCLLLLETPVGGLLLIVDTARFLLYGGMDGDPCIGGCVRVEME